MNKGNKKQQQQQQKNAIFLFVLQNSLEMGFWRSVTLPLLSDILFILY